jgi:hypothetical protein
VRHGKARSPQADVATVLKMWRATQVYHEHDGTFEGPNISHVRMPVRQQDLDFREDLNNSRMTN